MKKVLYVVDKIEGGGATRIIIRVAHMLEESYSPVLTSIVQSSGYENYNLKNIEVVFSNIESGGNIFKKAIRIFKNIRALVRIINEHDIECVLSFLERSNFCAVIAAKITGIKVIVSVRNNIDRQYSRFGTVGLSLIKYALSKTYNRAEHVVSLSKGIEAQLVQNLSIQKNKISTIYNPYYLEEYEEVNCSVISNEKYFLAVGRLDSQKGFDHLIKAFAIYRGLGGTNQLYILGEGRLKGYLTNLIQYYELDDNVRLVGYSDNVKGYMHNAEAFIFSSLWEGFGNALVEAILCKLPVISTDCDFGPAEILQCETASYPVYSKLGVLIEPFRKPFDKTIANNSQESQLANVMIHYDPTIYDEKDFLEISAEFSFLNVKAQWAKLVDSVLKSS